MIVYQIRVGLIDSVTKKTIHKEFSIDWSVFTLVSGIFPYSRLCTHQTTDGKHKSGTCGTFHQYLCAMTTPTRCEILNKRSHSIYIRRARPAHGFSKNDENNGWRGRGDHTATHCLTSYFHPTALGLLMPYPNISSLYILLCLQILISNSNYQLHNICLFIYWWF